MDRSLYQEKVMIRKLVVFEISEFFFQMLVGFFWAVGLFCSVKVWASSFGQVTDVQCTTQTGPWSFFTNVLMKEYIF